MCDTYREEAARFLREKWVWWLIPAALALIIIGALITTANTSPQPPVFVYPTP